MPAKKKTAAKKRPSRKRASDLVPVDLVPEKIAARVVVLRHEKVLLDTDLAELYGVEIRALNQAVKRNLDRFPEDFMFELTEDETEILRSQIGASSDAGSPLRSQSVTLKHDQHFQLVFDAIKQLIAAPNPSTREMGFHTRDT